MIFASLPYLIFLPVAAAVYFALPPQGRKFWLLVASYFFYGIFSPWLCLLLVYFTLLNYGVALFIDAPNTHDFKRRLWLTLALIGNFGMLFGFKYCTFFTGAELSPFLQMALPLGISFYTFQTSSYTIDVYRRVISAERNLLDVALYVSYFPSLISGPIMRAGDLVPQFREHHKIDGTLVLSGFLLICWGLAKKLFIAEPIGLIVDQAYDHHEAQSGAALVIATYGFAVQIFCDFSAYTDIAIGSARIMGFRLAENFNAPYLALSLRDFWRRWHITLSTWLRDYLYIPLGGNKHGKPREMASIMVTMVLGGLWHGASWNFVIWGGLHGLYLMGERFFHPGLARLPVILRWFITFHLVCLAWIFFRAETLPQAIEILSRIAFWKTGDALSAAPLLALAGILALQLLHLKADINNLLVRRPFLARWLGYGALAMSLVVLAGGPSPEFIYFQF